MRIYKETELRDFEAWSGAIYTMETLKKLDNVVSGDVFYTLENCIDDMGEGIDETELNDLLWFEQDTIADWLGYASWEMLERMASYDTEEIELKYKVGDIVNLTYGYSVEIIKVDENDTEGFPYRVLYIGENGDEIADWISEEEIED